MPAVWQEDEFTVVAGESVQRDENYRGVRFTVRVTYPRPVRMTEKLKKRVREIFQREYEAALNAGELN